jgi:hypothetical protein
MSVGGSGGGESASLKDAVGDDSLVGSSLSITATFRFDDECRALDSYISRVFARTLFVILIIFVGCEKIYLRTRYMSGTRTSRSRPVPGCTVMLAGRPQVKDGGNGKRMLCQEFLRCWSCARSFVLTRPQSASVTTRSNLSSDPPRHSRNVVLTFLGGSDYF